MAKLTLTDLGSLQNETTALATLAANNAATEAAVENTLSRDGTSPNQMTASLDMNNQQIINLPSPLSNNSPLRVTDVNAFSRVPAGGTTGQVLAKTSGTDYAVQWSSTSGGGSLNTVGLTAPAEFSVSGSPLTGVGGTIAVTYATTPTGTGKLVRDTSPTLVTPTLGVATATSINKVALTQPATGSTLTIADGKTLTANNSLILAGVDGNTYTFPSTGNVVTADSANTLTNKTIGAAQVSTGTLPTTVMPAYTGDVTAAANGTVNVIANNAVTNATMAQMATKTVKSNITGGTANVVDNTITAVLDAQLGTTNNTIPQRISGTWGATTATYPTTTGAGTVLTSVTANAIGSTSQPVLGVNGGTGGSLTLNGATSGSVNVNVPTAAGTSTNFTLPSSNGTSGQLLRTDGAGITTWITASGTGTVTQVNTSGIITGGPITATGTLNVNATIIPQGRITLQTGVGFMGTSTSGATTVRYTPYLGNLVPIYDGTNMVPTPFTELTQTTADTTKSPAAVGVSLLYDLFVWNDSGTIRCTRGPAWTDDLNRSVGTALTNVNGILLNNASITNGPAASRGTYVGTIGSNASSTIDWIYGTNASGTQAAVFNVWNMYNRLPVFTMVQDSTASWSYTTATYRSANGSNNNRVTFLMGQNETLASAKYSDCFTFSGTSVGNTAIGLDSTTVQVGKISLNTGNPTGSYDYIASWTGVPGLGRHFIQAQERGGAGSSQNGGSLMALEVSLSGM